MKPVTCIGVDITWWGGSKKKTISRRETIVAIRVDNHPSIAVEVVDLSPVPNPSSDDPREPNYDRDGSYFVDALLSVIHKVADKGDRIVIALDAPLEALHCSTQSPRRKAVLKGEKMGSTRRDCENKLSSYAASLRKPVGKAWNKDLKIQSGSPIPLRIVGILKLLAEHGFEVVRSSQQKPQKAIIEIFPSQAIWALGIQGHYGGKSSKHVRAYKAKNDKVMSNEYAFDVAERPLMGFLSVLSGIRGLDAALVTDWTDILAKNAVACSPGAKPGEVHKGKGFDDPIDSGIAALTCVAYEMGRYHTFGDGTDGTIVGPGVLPHMAAS